MKNLFFITSIFTLLFLCCTSFASKENVISYGYSALLENHEKSREIAIQNAKETIIEQTIDALLIEPPQHNLFFKEDYISNYKIVHNTEKTVYDNNKNLINLAIDTSVDFEKIYSDLQNSSLKKYLKIPEILVQIDAFENGKSVDSHEITNYFCQYLSEDFKIVSQDIYKNILINNLSISSRREKIIELAKSKNIDFIVFVNVISSEYLLKEKNMCSSKSVFRLECYSAYTKKKVYETQKPISITEIGNQEESNLILNTSFAVILSFFEDYKIRFTEYLYGKFAMDMYFSKKYTP